MAAIPFQMLQVEGVLEQVQRGIYTLAHDAPHVLVDGLMVC